MANTYTAISTVTVGAGGAANIEFTSIPQNFTDLLLFTSLRSTDTETRWGSTRIRFNSNSDSLYDYIEVYGTGSVAASGGLSSDTSGSAARNTPNGVTASVFSNGMTYITNYASSNNKSFSDDTVTENFGTAALSPLVANLFRSTSPITSLMIYPSGSFTFMQHSTATLYGIKNT